MQVSSITMKRNQHALSNMVFDTMQRENCSLLEASIIVSSIATSDEVMAAVTKRVDEYNNAYGVNK